MSKPEISPKKSSARKIAANQRNAQRSTGPHNCNLARYNSLRHGLLAEGITELDEPEAFLDYRGRLEMELKPVGEVETGLVRRIALDFVRLRRAAAIEAEYITAKLNPTIKEIEHPNFAVELAIQRMKGTTVVLDAGLPARLKVATIEDLQLFQRYEGAIENRLYRALNQLERLQRMRKGDAVQAPVAVDVGIHKCDSVASFGNQDGKRNLESR
jgi:hypothetical protein